MRTITCVLWGTVVGCGIRACTLLAEVPNPDVVLPDEQLWSLFGGDEMDKKCGFSPSCNGVDSPACDTYGSLATCATKSDTEIYAGTHETCSADAPGWNCEFSSANHVCKEIHPCQWDAMTMQCKRQGGSIVYRAQDSCSAAP